MKRSFESPATTVPARGKNHPERVKIPRSGADLICSRLAQGSASERIRRKTGRIAKGSEPLQRWHLGCIVVRRRSRAGIVPQEDIHGDQEELEEGQETVRHEDSSSRLESVIARDGWRREGAGRPL